MKNSYYLIAVVCLVLCLTQHAKAQKHPVLTDSKELLKEGIALYEEEKYGDAIEKFAQVHPSDSEYFAAQYELSLAYLQKEDYKKVIAISTQAIHDGSRIPSQYYAWGNALKGLKKYDEALAVYEQGLARFPFNESLHVNKGFVYEAKGEPAKALEVYKNILSFDPLHASTHLRLARMNVGEGNITQAIMSYVLFLVIEPSSGRSLTVLTEFNNLCNGSSSDLDSAKNKAIKREFDDINFIVTNQVALNDKYKVPGKFSFPVVKQVHLVMEKLVEIKTPDEGFYASFYMPFFTTVFKTKSFENFALLLLASSDKDEIGKQVTKNMSNIRNLRDECLRIWSTAHPYYELMVNGRKQTLKKWYYNDFSIQAFGTENEKKQNVGDWQFISTDGTLEVTGSYNDKGERNGAWYFFNSGGDTLKLLTYRNGLADGPYRIYSDGFLKETGSYKNDLLEGEVLTYFPDGSLLGRDVFSKDKRNGPGTTYYPNGGLRYEYTYKNNILNGAYNEYFANGKLSGTSVYTEGKHTGGAKTFYVDGQVQKEFNYHDDVVTGAYKTYWRNGTVESEGNAAKGSVSGKWRYYYADGSVRELSTYDESGKINGEEQDFDHHGRIYKQATFVKGDVKKVQYFNIQGKVFYESKLNRNGSTLAYYNFHRDKVSEGMITEGERDGEWKFYYPVGTLSGTENYKNKKKEGPSIDYFKNGKISVEQKYENDEAEGYYKSLYSNGRLHTEGNYKGGEQWGLWYEYYMDGTLKEVTYYVAGDARGMLYEYGVSGKLTKKYRYNNNGVLTGIYHCDTNGVVTDSALFRSGTAYFSLKGASGKKYYEGGFLAGVAHKKQAWYFPNGQVCTMGESNGGSRVGEWTWMHPNGKLFTKGSYFMGEETGAWEYYDFFGNITHRIENKFGKANGKYVWYYPDGKVKSQSDFYQDDRNGSAYYYARNGDLREVRYYEFGKYVGYSYHNKSKILVDTIFANNGEGGIRSYYANGNVSAEYTIKSGEYHGVYKLFYPDGKLQEERLYDYGLEAGPTKEYYNDGKPARIENYNNGAQHGEVTEYNENGSLRLREHYMNDAKHGLCEYFDRTGKRTNAMMYANDEVIAIIQ